MSSRPIPYFVTGVTCSGKDYLIEQALEKYPELIGAVQVGKEFRKRYPPERFRGLAAMPDTEEEAKDIFREQYQAVLDSGKPLVLISSLPRMGDQVAWVLPQTGHGVVLWVYTDDETTQQRLDGRFPVNDPDQDIATKARASLELSRQRLFNDRLQLYDVLFRLQQAGNSVRCFQSGKDDLEAFLYRLVRTRIHAVATAEAPDPLPLPAGFEELIRNRLAIYAGQPDCLPAADLRVITVRMNRRLKERLDTSSAKTRYSLNKSCTAAIEILLEGLAETP